jgi:hypothetical protein
MAQNLVDKDNTVYMIGWGFTPAFFKIIPIKNKNQFEAIAYDYGIPPQSRPIRKYTIKLNKKQFEDIAYYIIKLNELQNKIRFAPFPIDGGLKIILIRNKKTFTVELGHLEVLVVEALTTKRVKDSDIKTIVKGLNILNQEFFSKFEKVPKRYWHNVSKAESDQVIELQNQILKRLKSPTKFKFSEYERK